MQLSASLVKSVGSQYVCFNVKLKLICANLRIILHYQTGAAAAHTGGLCGGVMQPVAGGGYVALPTAGNRSSAKSRGDDNTRTNTAHHPVRSVSALATLGQQTRGARRNCRVSHPHTVRRRSSPPIAARFASGGWPPASRGASCAPESDCARVKNGRDLLYYSTSKSMIRRRGV